MSGKFSRVMTVLLCLILIAALSPAAFAEDAADFDGDGEITVGDAIGITNKILE